jgi:hypothetical protein
MGFDIHEVLNKTGDVVSEGVDILKDKTEDIDSGAVNFVKKDIPKVYDNAVDAARGAFDSVGDTAKDITSNAIDFAKNDITKAFDNAIDTVGDGANAAKDALSSFHENYISKVIPQDGIFGNAIEFGSEIIPGVSELNDIRDGDWKMLAVDAGIDIAMIALPVAGGIVLGTKVATKLAEKAAVKAVEKGIAKVGVEVTKVAGKVVDDVVEIAGKVVDDVVKSAEKVVDDVGEKFSKESVEESAKKGTRLPVEGKNGKWKGERGDSKWQLNPDDVPASRYNTENLTNQQLANKYDKGKLDIEFKNNDMDLKQFSKFDTKIDNFTENRAVNFQQADAKFAKSNKITPTEAKKFREENKLTWHEKADGTMQLVPQVINDMVPHKGGISKMKGLVE